MYKEELDYQYRYADLPNTQEELVKFIEDHHRLNFDKIAQMEEHIKSIEWETIEFELPLVPKGSPRPRFNRFSKRVYVKGAKKNKKIIRQYIEFAGIICTRVEFILTVYLPIPSGMTINEIYLAEKGLILPISKPDFDNLAKTYSDALLQSLLLDDNIINPGIIKKYYSIKPRVKIEIRYQKDFDSKYNRNKTLNSKTYKSIVDGEKGETDEE